MSAASNLTTLRRFYDAFSALDAATMQACYAEQARFDDEAFSLAGREQIGGMWRMLCGATSANPASASVWKLEYRLVGEDAAHWEAHYLFSATGRMVHNRIDARFEFDEQGLILRHVDRFDFWAWSRQALGTPGWLLGWSPWLRAKVRRQAAANLARFMSRG